MGVDTGVEIQHVTQYLADKLDKGELKFKNVGKGIKATYHDPCHLGRHCGIYEEPRKLIEALGYELAEMPRNRGSAWCCGAGGGVKSGYPEWALWTATERIKEAVETGAKVLLTSCPFCEMNLRDAIKDIGADIEVVDLNEPVLRALRG
jgi:Fe-S oxidoreductase